MDTKLNYAEICKRILNDYVKLYTQGTNFPLRTLFDEVKQSYILLDVGWYGDEYIHNALIHLEIIDGKIWIQNDDTEEGVATDLLEAGIPKDNIVLGFRPPKLRVHTGFAVA